MACWMWSRALVADVEDAFFRADGERADAHALDDRVRTALHDRAVHERAGVAFVAIADDVLGPFVVAGGTAPFSAGREAGTAFAAQAALFDLRDDFVGRQGKGALKAFVAAVRTVLVQAERVDNADVLEHEFVLACIERVVSQALERLAVLLVQKLLHRLALKRGDDGGGVARGGAVVHDVARHKAHDGALLAFARAAGAHQLNGDVVPAAGCELCLQRFGEGERAVGDAAGAAAHEDSFGSVNHGSSHPQALPHGRSPVCRESARPAVCCSRCRPPP